MTENKRFIDIEICADIGQIRLYTTDEQYKTYSSEDILNMINYLSEQNDYLIKENNILENADKNYIRALLKRKVDLEKENDELKQELETCKDANVRCCNDYSAMRRIIFEYQEENEKLKNKMELFKALAEGVY